MAWIRRLKGRLRPEYRIIRSRAARWEAQVRRWWWPFWRHVEGTYAFTAGDAEHYLMCLLRRPTEVRYLGRL
jgi:hypothetical protein